VEASRYGADAVPPRKSTPVPRRTGGKLSPGQRLPPKDVAASQRERLFAAMIDLVDERGYQATTVTDVLARASVSRASFYELFANKENCFLSAYDLRVARVAGEILSAYSDPKLASPERLSTALATFFEIVAGWPGAARVTISEIATAGRQGMQRREQSTTVAEQKLASLLRQTTKRTSMSPTITKALIGGIRQVTYNRLRENRQNELPTLVEDLISWMLVYDRAPPPGRHASSRKRQSERPYGKQCEASDAVAAETTTTGHSPAAQAQRRRILQAVVAISSKKGYHAMTHSEIAATARISYGTFYKHFPDKQAAFLAAFDATHQQLIDTATEAFQAAPTWPQAIVDALRALLNLLADEPELCRVSTLEIFSAGRAGIEHLDRALQRYEPLLEPGYQQHPRVPALWTEAILGAVNEVIYHYALADKTQELPRLSPQLAYIVLAPFVGSQEALKITTQRAQTLQGPTR
jgi:AcrR family transcriptional regulator